MDTAAATDLELLDVILAGGDERAFRELYRRQTPRLYQFVLRVVGGNDADAQDVVQQTWLLATHRAAAFRREAAFSTWLNGIGLNVARSLLRREGRWAELDAAAEPGVPPSRTSERIDLERAIAMLPPGYRLVLVLHDVEGYTHEEIAGRLGIAVGTSKSQLSRARRAARSLLNGGGRRNDG